MSADNCEAEDTSLRCAACGIAEDDDVKLKKCNGCYLVRYCGVECQREHRLKHKQACKKRAAELRDELLFKQPESSHRGDCPICMVPLPLGLKNCTMMTCCSKFICDGCNYANQMREIETRRDQKCPFCREAAPETGAECDKQRMKRIEINDPVAMRKEGKKQYSKGDYHSAFEYYTKAAELGDVEAHYELSNLYRWGEGVEKDMGESMNHAEEAAIGGHPYARHNLGAYEWINGDKKRAMKHWIISATQGDDKSIKGLIEGFKEGLMGKEDLNATLRAHQATLNSMKSPQREAAEKCNKMMMQAMTPTIESRQVK